MRALNLAQAAERTPPLCRVVLRYSRGDETFAADLDGSAIAVGDRFAFDGDVWRVDEIRRAEPGVTEVICSRDA